MKDIWTICKFIVPLGYQEILSAASQIQSESTLLFILFSGSIVAFLASFLYVAILFGFRFSVHEVEGPFLLALLEDFSSLVVLGVIWAFATNALIFVLRMNEDIGWMFRGAYMFMYAHVAFASVRHMHEIYVTHVRGVKYEERNLQGKVYIVTGSNQGCGYETTLAMVKMGATVVMACRSMDKANKAKEAIIKASGVGPSKLVVMELDLSSFRSVRNFVKEFLALGVPLHGLVNNAGLMSHERVETQDGLEMVVTANHFSHFLLSNLLVDVLDKTAKKEKGVGRVVTLSSALHKNTPRFNFDDVMFAKPGAYSMFPNYSQSKLANILFTDALQTRMDASNKSVVCNSVHPGCVMTDVSRNMHWLMRFGEKLAQPLLALLRKTPEEGAYCSVFAATSSVVEEKGIKGAYLFHCSPCSKGQGATQAAADQLWEVSEQVVQQEFAH